MKFGFSTERTPWKHKIANFLATYLKTLGGGYLGRQRFILTCWIYRILPYLGFDYCRLIEWQSILRNLPQNKKRKILDVGCTSSLFIYELAARGYEAYGIDTRRYSEKLPSKIRFIRADVTSSPFSANFFDCIILISVIEHVGLGGYKDPIHDDGDFKAMKEFKRILQPEGILFISTVVGNKHIITPNGNQRIYDEKRFHKLLEEFFTVKEEYYIFRKKWTPVDKRKAFREPPQRFGLAVLRLKRK